MEKKILTSMNIELRWTSTLFTLYPVEEAAAEASTASEGPTVAAFSVSGLRDALPSWPKDKPMPRSERRRRVVCWNCSTRDHYAHECPTMTDRPHGSGGGPSASFMITTTKKPRKPSVAGPSVDATMSPLSKPTGHKWLIDSGASNNIKPTATRLTNYDAGGSEVTVANGQTLDSPGRGFIAIATSLGGAVTLTDTTLVPGISTNLFSVRAADRAGGDIRFYQGTCAIKQNGVTVAMGYVNKDEQYELALGSVNKRKTAPVPPHANVAYGKANPRGDLWHRRLGHFGYANVGKAANIATGMSITGADIEANIGTVCEPCVKARMQVHSHGAGERATEPLERLCVDMTGPITSSSDGGAVHALSLTDACTDMSFVTPLKSKAEAGAVLRDRIVYLENQTNKTVKIIRTDGAKEILNNDIMKQFMQAKGIKPELSAPYSPKQNGKAERHNRVVMERTRAMLLGSGLPLSNWAEAMFAATFVMNRSPTGDGTATPYERFYGKRPDVSMLRVWGSKAYAKRPSKQAGKLASRVIAGHMVSYSSGGHAWRIRSAASGAIMTRRDVEFDETAPTSPFIPDALPVCLYLPKDWSDTDSSTSSDGGAGVPSPLQGIPVINNLSDAVALLPATVPPAAADLDPLAQHSTVPQALTAPQIPARTHDFNLRARKGTGEPSALSASAHSTLAGGDRAPIPAYAPVTLEAAVAHHDWCADPPQSRAEALSRHDAYLWQAAMDDEYKALVDTDTWTIVQLPRGARWTRGKWVFAYKQDADGKVTRYKARFVGCGYSQRAGVDYNEIWAPCPARATVRAVLAYAASHDFELDTIDIKTAYLNAPMDVDVYVDLPVGYSGVGPNTVAELGSALYGTKQAGRLWAENLCATLTAAGANRSTTDPTLYT